METQLLILMSFGLRSKETGAFNRSFPMGGRGEEREK